MKHSAAFTKRYDEDVVHFELNYLAPIIDDDVTDETRYVAVIHDRQDIGDDYLVGGNTKTDLRDAIKHRVEKLLEYEGSPVVNFAWDRKEDKEIPCSTGIHVIME